MHGVPKEVYTSTNGRGDRDNTCLGQVIGVVGPTFERCWTYSDEMKET